MTSVSTVYPPKRAYDLGMLEARKGNKKEAKALFEQAAEHGHTESYYMLATYSESEKMAAELFYLAAKDGHAESQLEFGLCLFFGTGIEQDKAEAAMWIKKAARKKLPRAMTALATMDPVWSNVDPEDYDNLIEEAADLDDAKALYRRFLKYTEPHKTIQDWIDNGIQNGKWRDGNTDWIRPLVLSACHGRVAAIDVFMEHSDLGKIAHPSHFIHSYPRFVQLAIQRKNDFHLVLHYFTRVFGISAKAKIMPMPMETRRSMCLINWDCRNAFFCKLRLIYIVADTRSYMNSF